MRPNLKKIRFGRMTEKKKFYIANAKQKTMEKRNDILLFVQDRATRENNIKGRIDLRDFGALKSLRKDAETSKMAKLALKNAFELKEEL